MRIVPIECVTPGNFLAKTIFDNDGRILLREGVQLTDNFIRKIKQLKIQSLYITDEFSEKVIEDIIKPELRQKAIKTIKDTFYSFEKYNLYSQTGNNYNDKKMLKERETYFQTIGDVAREIIDEILTQKNLMINLVDIKSMDNYTYQHSVNVAVISLVLGVQLQLNREELYHLCMGALVHDMGKVLIPKEIIQKPTPLTSEEFEIVKAHTLKGYDYLKGCLDISAPSRIVALQHHEKVDGSGYPDNLKGKSINRYARIVAIADVYDALTSDRPYRRAMCPNEAVEYILAYGDKYFDYEMVKAFAKAVVPYPEGTLVKLTTGDIAVVEELFPNFPLRPTVKVVKKGDGPLCKEVNTLVPLVSELDVVIENIVHTI